MFTSWKAKLAVIAGFLGGLLNWFAFFGIDAKTIREQMTAHYVFLILAVAFSALFIFGVYWWWRSSRVTTKNIEQKVKQWTDAFGLSRKISTDDKFHFVIVVSPRPTQHVMIRQPKDHPSYLELRSSLRTTSEQQDLFEKMGKETQQSVRRTLDLECARSKIEYHSNQNPEKLDFVCIHKQIPITPDLTDARFIDSLNEMRFAVAVVGHTLNDLFKAPP